MDPTYPDLITRLEEAARSGNVDTLYELLDQDPYLLEQIDQIPLIETPLHIAAAFGKIEFAMEIMILKASFAKKLNKSGLTPMYLAVQNGHELIVLWLLDVDSALVRVKGRGGRTPLHCAAEFGNSSIMAEIFEACPESILDVTNNGDTAMHIALRSGQIEAFEILLGWLRRCVFKDSNFWQRELLNWKNKEGDTLLHIALSRNLHKAVTLLVSTRVYGDIPNQQRRTAADILTDPSQILRGQNIRMLQSRPRFFRGSNRPLDNLSSPVTICEQQTLRLDRLRNILPADRYNVLLVVHALIATVTFQTALSPPGGVWQGQSENNLPSRSIIHINSPSNSTQTRTTVWSSSHFVGTSIMGGVTFTLFWLANSSLFFVTVARIIRQEGAFLLFSCYLLAMSVISPNKIWSNINLALFFLVALYYLPQWIYRAMIGYSNRKMGWNRSRKIVHDRKEWWQ
ncbi:hypothetical protein K2173_020450 [Erythroxylum novogranatense]|uniref:PGG domain-containing protein n=1 Tax=Erythroxylum novogranatense TaxID=1862640 RepID=A0AAV8TIH1_9ROSI|nr:hypothetical protein K2173_020450 [Erythroxylum novogranatense]